MPKPTRTPEELTQWSSDHSITEVQELGAGRDVKDQLVLSVVLGPAASASELRRNTESQPHLGPAKSNVPFNRVTHVHTEG